MVQLGRDLMTAMVEVGELEYARVGEAMFGHREELECASALKLRPCVQTLEAFRKFG